MTPPAATGGLWSVRAGEDPAIRKLVVCGAGSPRWPASAEVRDPWYWRREPEVYASGLLDRLGGGLRAPGVRAIVDVSEDEVALWLEQVPEAAAWTAERLGAVAYRLGVAQGELAADPPRDAWLARGWLRSYLALRRELMDGTTGADEAATLARLDSLPQTFCHNDLHPANLLGESGSVVVDWAFCGLAAVGLDAGVLAADSVLDGFVPLADASRLGELVWDGYASGLRDASFSDLAAARWAFLAGTPLRLSWLAGWVGRPDVDTATRERFQGFLSRLAAWTDEASRLPSRA